MAGRWDCLSWPHASDLGQILSIEMNPLASLGRYGIRAIDWIVRKIYRITPLSNEPDCILRISREPSKWHASLSDGVEVKPGNPIILLHLWNERVLEFLQPHEPLGWTRYLLRRFLKSLPLLNEQLNQQAWGDEIVAMRAEFGFLVTLDVAGPILSPLGFDVMPVERPRGRFWRRAFWDNLYSYLLMWTFNPKSLQGKELTNLLRAELWISRERLRERYGK
jgi:hypothetical protein